MNTLLRLYLVQEHNLNKLYTNPFYSELNRKKERSDFKDYDDLPPYIKTLLIWEAFDDKEYSIKQKLNHNLDHLIEENKKTLAELYESILKDHVIDKANFFTREKIKLKKSLNEKQRYQLKQHIH